MKCKKLRFIVPSLLLVCSLSLTACGNADKTTTNNNTENINTKSITTPTSTPTSTATSAYSEAKFKGIQEQIGDKFTLIYINHIPTASSTYETFIVADNETGVEYIATPQHGMDITYQPRFGTDKTIMVDKKYIKTKSKED